MANAREGNVIRVDTSADFADVRSFCGIKYVGAASGTAAVKAENSSGDQIWEHSGNVIVFDQVKIRSDKGVRVEVANSAVVYLYLKV